MVVLPWYQAPDQIKSNYLTVADKIIAIQIVNPQFDKAFNDNTFALIANGREIRTTYVPGTELGDPINRYYLQIC